MMDSLPTIRLQGRESLTNIITLLSRRTWLYIWTELMEGIWTEKILKLSPCGTEATLHRYNFNLPDSEEPTDELRLIKTSLPPCVL